MVDATNRDTPWRQGMVLDEFDVTKLGLVSQDFAGQAIAVLVSHDCDIANLDKEPLVEIIVGRRIGHLGADANAKTARRLHVAFQVDGEVVAVELLASDKKTIANSALRQGLPRAGWYLMPEGLVTLQLWLAARYRREAFPEEFENRLKAKPNQIHKKIEKALTSSAEHILAVFFEVDGGEERSHDDASDVYQLSIVLLYDSTKDEPLAHAVAEQAVEAIVDAFEAAFFLSSRWVNIQLLRCSAVSDNVMTIAQSRLLKQWRLDHMSLEEDPQQPMLG